MDEHEKRNNVYFLPQVSFYIFNLIRVLHFLVVKPNLYTYEALYCRVMNLKKTVPVKYLKSVFPLPINAKYNYNYEKLSTLNSIQLST